MMKKIIIIPLLFFIFFTSISFAGIVGTWKQISYEVNGCSTSCPGQVECEPCSYYEVNGCSTSAPGQVEYEPGSYVDCPITTLQFNTDSTWKRHSIDGVETCSESGTYRVVNNVLTISEEGCNVEMLTLSFSNNILIMTVKYDDGEIVIATFNKIQY